MEETRIGQVLQVSGLPVPGPFQLLGALIHQQLVLLAAHLVHRLGYRARHVEVVKHDLVLGLHVTLLRMR